MATKDWKSYEISIVRTGKIDKGPKVESPITLAGYFNSVAENELQESLFTVLFNARNEVIGISRIYTGTATGTSVALHELFRAVVAAGAVGMALVHNHPSGDCEPSDADVHLTKEVINASRIMDTEFLDHLVIGTNGYTSIRSKHPSMWDRSEESRVFE